MFISKEIFIGSFRFSLESILTQKEKYFYYKRQCFMYVHLWFLLPEHKLKGKAPGEYSYIHSKLIHMTSISYKFVHSIFKKKNLIIFIYSASPVSKNHYCKYTRMISKGYRYHPQNTTLCNAYEVSLITTSGADNSPRKTLKEVCIEVPLLCE